MYEQKGIIIVKRILITGGNGVFGRSFVKTLEEQGQQVRIMSRKPAPENLKSGLEWAQADVTTGEGLEAALEDVHSIVNCMSKPISDTYETDVAGLQRLLSKARKMGVQYLIRIKLSMNPCF
jgi:nucleoside-diphosphate-sugar epimerase